jgi:Fe2+ transport system protein FeoA
MPIASSLRYGQEAMIVRFTDEYIENKLTSMGMMPGSMLRMIRKAPFGGGFYIKIDNTTIAIRSQELQHIIVGI